MQKLPNLPRRVLIGLGFIYAAGLGWLAEFIIPFVQFDHKRPVFVVVLVAAELSFVIGIAIIGKTYYRQLKDRLIAFIKS